MSQGIVLILTDNIRATSVYDQLDRPSAQVAERDKFGVAVNYVTVCELPREDTWEDYKTNELIDPAFTADLTDHVFYDLTFNDRRLFDAVLEQLLLHSGTNLKRTWIDNDYGVVLPAAVVFESGDEDWKMQRYKDD